MTLAGKGLSQGLASRLITKNFLQHQQQPSHAGILDHGAISMVTTGT